MGLQNIYNTMEEILKFKKRLISENRVGLALDIDETLSFTIGLLVERLMNHLGNPENLTAKEIVDKYKHTDNIPYWQSDLANKIIEDCVNSDEVQKDLPLIENANKIVQKINKIIPIIAYITVRPQTVVNGTKMWLERHGFPKAEIIARPIDIAKADGNKWKAGVLEFLHPQIVGIVDDNPGLVSKLSPNYQGTVYLYDNTKCQENHIDVIPCNNWTKVYDAVLLKKNKIKL